MADPAVGNMAPSLKDISYMVFLEDIICRASPATAEFVKEYIEVWAAVRKYQNDFRCNCIVQLNARCFTKNGQTSLDVCAILDCVLDDTFTKLEIRIPYETIKFFSSLMSVIAHRSPKLKTLKITFCSLYPQLQQPHTEPPFKKRKEDPLKLSDCISIPPLKCLTSLALHHRHTNVAGRANIIADDLPYEPILGVVAKCCPVLTDLSVRGLCLRVKRDLLELILGDYATDQLAPFDNTLWSGDEVLPSLRVPKEFLSPLCSTLQKIELICLCSKISKCFCFRSCKNSILHPFTLAHLPELQIVKCGRSITTPSYYIGGRQRESTALDDVETHFIGFPTFLFGIFSTWTSLVIPVKDIEMMRDAGALCLNMKHIEFTGNISNRLENINDKTNWNQHTDLSHTTMHSILNNWPKVDAITLKYINCAACIKCILNALGPDLRSLTLHYIDEDVGDFISFLAPCTKLENLTILDTLALPSTFSGPPDDLDSNNFLPSLKQLESNTCLGKWSPLLESKPTLTKLKLACCHIGTVSRLPPLEWNQTSKCWPNMKSLTLNQCTGMTMAVLSSLVPQLKNLEVIELPTSIRENETDEHVREVVDGLMKSREDLKEVGLWRSLYSDYERCSFQSTEIENGKEKILMRVSLFSDPELNV